MARLNSKEYKDRLERLERMADGIARFGKESKFPPTLDEEETRKMKLNLDETRTDYEEKQRNADLAYDSYNNLTEQIDDYLAKCDNALRGFYGKTNPVLANFGTNVPKERSAAKPKTAPSDKPK